MIHLDYLKKVANNNLGFVKEMLAIYINETPNALQTIYDYINFEKFDVLFGAVHDLKNTIGFLGATDLFNLITEIEVDLEGGRPKAASIRLLREAMDTVRDSMDEAVQTMKSL